MPHLKRGTSGHLLRNAAGHLTRGCADVVVVVNCVCDPESMPSSVTVSGHIACYHDDLVTIFCESDFAIELPEELGDACTYGYFANSFTACAGMTVTLDLFFVPETFFGAGDCSWCISFSCSPTAGPDDVGESTGTGCKLGTNPIGSYSNPVMTPTGLTVITGLIIA